MQTKVIYINSSSQFIDAGGSPEDFAFTKEINEFSGVPKFAKLSSACVPYMWDNVTADNNVFDAFEVAAGTDTLTIPAGSYSGASLATAVQDLLNASGVLTQTYVVTYDATTFKFSFSTVDPNGLQLTFNEPGSAALLLGFDQDSTFPGAPSTSFDSPATTQTDHEIFICSNLVAGSDNGVIQWDVNYTPTSSNQQQILARIPANTVFGDTIFYKSSVEDPWFPISQVDLTYMRFFLKFPSGITVNMNNNNWSAEILVKI